MLATTCTHNLPCCAFSIQRPMAPSGDVQFCLYTLSKEACSPCSLLTHQTIHNQSSPRLERWVCVGEKNAAKPRPAESGCRRTCRQQCTWSSLFRMRLPLSSRHHRRPSRCRSPRLGLPTPVPRVTGPGRMTGASAGSAVRRRRRAMVTSCRPRATCGS